MCTRRAKRPGRRRNRVQTRSAWHRDLATCFLMPCRPGCASIRAEARTNYASGASHSARNSGSFSRALAARGKAPAARVASSARLRAAWPGFLATPARPKPVRPWRRRRRRAMPPPAVHAHLPPERRDLHNGAFGPAVPRRIPKPSMPKNFVHQDRRVIPLKSNAANVPLTIASCMLRLMPMVGTRRRAKAWPGRRFPPSAILPSKG